MDSIWPCPTLRMFHPWLVMSNQLILCLPVRCFRVRDPWQVCCWGVQPHMRGRWHRFLKSHWRNISSNHWCIWYLGQPLAVINFISLLQVHFPGSCHSMGHSVTVPGTMLKTSSLNSAACISISWSWLVLLAGTAFTCFGSSPTIIFCHRCRLHCR